ncbi:MAG TPA: ATP-binding SpoIIE family protein phosphatase [Candidatus Polarisedimenticolaceae bacterium]|nr:ATP-binding SpoIIE family protein phosphatase [Candidatus Polarisedimenticolaceae bacterium]
MNLRSVHLCIDHVSAVGEARRAARDLAKSVGMDAAEGGKLELAVTELGTNLLQHAGEGDLLLRGMNGTGRAVEVVAVDRGPGMLDPAACLRDGHSTVGTPGTGLGAVRRLAAEFDLLSRVGDGTAVFARIGRPSGPPVQVGAVCVPCRGEQACGDAWAVASSNPSWRVVLADGLGHGVEAAHASDQAVRVFEQHGADSPAHVLEHMHRVLRSTRGAAALVLGGDAATGSLRACGVGNVSAAVVGEQGTRQVTSVNGTLGHAVRKLAEFVYTWPRTALLVAHSDGLSSQLTLERYRGWQARHPSLLAGLLWRDFGKSHDDATVLVLRYREAAA